MGFYGQGQEFQMIEDAVEAGGMAWWIMELPSGVVFFSPNKVKMLGYSEEDAKKFVHYTSFTDIVHPDDFDSCMKAMQDLLDGKKDIYETQYRIKAKDGTYITLYDRGRVVGKKGENVAIAGIVLNVTDNPILLRSES